MNTEDLLRARLHEIDEVQPPEPDDFAFRTLDAGRQRMRRRQSWTRGLVGAAAAVAIGALVLPAIGRNPSSGGSASSSAVAGSTAAQEQAPVQAPNPAASGGQDQEIPNSAQQGPPVGPNDKIDREIEAVLVTLRGPLARAYPDSFTALELDGSTTPPRVVLHMTIDTPAAQRVVRNAVSPNIPVVSEGSAYSSSACALTFQALSVDTEWAGRDVQLAPKNCNAQGRVEVSVIGTAASAVLGEVDAKYGDRIVAGASGQK